jgi:hypothetical protein
MLGRRAHAGSKHRGCTRRAPRPAGCGGARSGAGCVLAGAPASFFLSACFTCFIITGHPAVHGPAGSNSRGNMLPHCKVPIHDHVPAARRKQIIELWWVSKPLALAGGMKPRRLNNHVCCVVLCWGRAPDRSRCVVRTGVKHRDVGVSAGREAPLKRVCQLAGRSQRSRGVGRGESSDATHTSHAI